MPASPAIIFDLGKVLVDFDWSIAAGKIAARSLKPPKDFTHFSPPPRCCGNTNAA